VSAGILILRSEQGIQFTDATSIVINGKDKALSLGNRVTGGPISKLPSVRIAGTLLNDRDSGVIAQYDGGRAEYLVPQGLPKGAPEEPAAIWKSTPITYKKSASDKAGTNVAADSFVAFLPGGTEELARLCMDAQALQLIGGKGKTFASQVELMSAVAKQYGADPAIAPLERYVADAMRTRYEAFEKGAGGLDVLKQGLQFVEMSKAVYGARPEQQKLRDQLTARNAWLERKIAILKAFAAAAEWDVYLLAARDFERYLHAFPEMSKQHAEALQQSLLAHEKAAAARKQEGDYELAYREFHLVSLRKPSDNAAREEAMQAWAEYSRRTAMDRQGKRTRLAAGPQSTIERDLFFAEQNKQAKKLDDAVKNVQAAEAVLQSSLPAGAFSTETLKVLYAKAELLGAQEHIGEALAALDAHDLLAMDDERTNAEKLRNQLLFSLNASMKTLKGKIQAAWAEGSLVLTAQLAGQTLAMKGDDADALYYAGVSAAVRRQPAEAREFFTRYLEASNTVDAAPEQRALVNRLLPSLAPPVQRTDGDANWLSGEKLPKGVFYCPVSLAFQPAIEQIDGSNKVHVVFDWSGERLRSVTPSAEGSTGERKISFAYTDKMPQVVWASDAENARPPATVDADETYKRAPVLLLNNPLIDPAAVERFTGKNPAVGIAFNKFFNPFVWDKLYYFRLTYDDRGRVTGARELNGPSGNPGERSLEFEWDGLQLTAIRGYLGKTKNYERTMRYQGGLLVGEEIQGDGKASQIKYVYAGNRLVSAEAGKDTTLDNRNRKVTFRSTSPSTQVK
jgi:hypothetical protein